MGNILAYHMIEKQNIRGETRPHANFTRSSLMVSNSILQVLPPAYPGDKRHGNQFGLKYPSKDAFVIFIAESLMGRNILETTLYAPR
jgi:hypothetical protein